MRPTINTLGFVNGQNCQPTVRYYTSTDSSFMTTLATHVPSCTLQRDATYLSNSHQSTVTLCSVSTNAANPPPFTDLGSMRL